MTNKKKLVYFFLLSIVIHIKNSPFPLKLIVGQALMCAAHGLFLFFIFAFLITLIPLVELQPRGNILFWLLLI
jgi:hypothetical protein